MASVTFPGSTSGVVLSVNSFDAAGGGTPWAPSDAYVGAGIQHERAGNHGNSIALNPDFPFDLSTLGSTTGNITLATITYNVSGTYTTIGPGANYSFAGLGDPGLSKSQADGAAWSVSTSYDATLYFTDGATYFTDMADLPTYAWDPAFACGGSIDNGVNFGFTITSLSIAFTYDGSTLDSLTPTHGPYQANTPVRLTGTGLTGATSVLFGTTAAINVVVESDTSIRCLTPEHAVGLVDVSVVLP